MPWLQPSGIAFPVMRGAHQRSARRHVREIAHLADIGRPRVEVQPHQNSSSKLPFDGMAHALVELLQFFVHLNVRGVGLFNRELHGTAPDTFT